MFNYDFFIDKEFRGWRVQLPEGMLDWPEEPVELVIPLNAFYLDVNPLEDEEERNGCQDWCDRQQLNYYDKNGKYLTTQNLEFQIITSRLMSRLERLLKKQY